MKNVRQDLGFTQEELAVILGVSRSLISLYDKGMRTLPANALEKLSRIHLLATENENPCIPCRKMLALQQKHRERAQALLHAHAKKAAAQAVRLSAEIAASKERVRQLEHKLQLIQLLMQEFPAGSREMRVLSNMEEQTLHLIDMHDLSAEYANAFRLSLLITQQQLAIDMQQKLERKASR